MQNLLVSILIPFKNTAKYLPDCINSIISQTYTNWELIIIDDGSTDHSYEIVMAYAKSDSRIQLYKNNGSGIIEALRFAFTKSKGSFITRMDSDDIMTPNKLDVLSNNLRSFGKGHVAIGQVKYFSESGINEGYAKYEVWLNALTEKGDNYNDIYKECVIPSPCWMVYKDDLLACDAFEPNRYPEDYDLTFRFYEYGLTCIPCNEILHEWRDYTTRTSRTHEHYTQNNFLDIKLHYFIKLNYNSKRPLVIWGAGFKGKSIAKSLVEQSIPFYWVCDNPKKIGKKIYDQLLLDFKALKQFKNPQSIITVANADAQEEIRTYFKALDMQSMKDYFFFC